jgi:hypothetical protein
VKNLRTSTPNPIASSQLPPVKWESKNYI